MTLKDKVILYREIYDKILKLINTGVYPVGSKLPSEVELSKMMNVSRKTLRQSLTLLQEDGFIETIHGQGSFIKDTAKMRGHGLEKIGNTVFSCCTEDIDDIHIDFQVEFVNDYDYIKSIFNIDTALVLACTRWYKSNNKVVAYTFSTMPSEVASQLKINFNDSQSLQKMLEEEIYGLAHSRSIEVKHTKSVPPSTNYKLISKNNLFTLLIEVLYDSIGNVILLNKIYIPTELSSIKFHHIK